jgi:hypothetical protein
MVVQEKATDDRKMQDVPLHIFPSRRTRRRAPQESQPSTASISQQPAFVGSAQTIQFTATVMGDTPGVTWAINGIVGGNSTVGPQW